MMLRQKVPKVKIKRLAPKGLPRKLQFTDLPISLINVASSVPDLPPHSLSHGVLISTELLKYTRGNRQMPLAALPCLPVG